MGNSATENRNSKVEQYVQLHSNFTDYGPGAASFIEEICLMIEYLKPKSILDYGCGKGALADKLQELYPDIKVYKYDPAIPEYNKLPVDHVDFLINTDVLEHIPIDELPSVVEEISKLSQNCYFNLHHTSANKILPNGENAHCTIMTIGQYERMFEKYFKSLILLRGRVEWTSVVLTFPVKSYVYNSYYSILRRKQAETAANNAKKLKFKDKIRLKIYNHIGKILTRKGII